MYNNILLKVVCLDHSQKVFFSKDCVYFLMLEFDIDVQVQVGEG